MRSEKDKASEGNVISIFGAAKKAKEAPTPETPEELTFEEAMQKNKAAQDRMRKERKKANRSVLRSYRLKN